MRAFLIKFAIFGLAVVACTIALDYYRGRSATERVPVAGTEASIETCFVPYEDCTQFVVETIELAEREILVLAYNFTSAEILQALGDAKQKRKLDVRVILDRSNEQPRYTGGTYVANRGVPVLIDDSVTIAHNKVIIIDRTHVLTGSFNFTKAAQKRNAENLVLIRDAPELAKRFADYWENRAKVSRPLQQRTH